MRICDPEQPEQAIEARAILDTGSQQSYATNRVKETLQLTPHRHQSLSIMTFGSNDRKAQTCEVVKILVVTRDGASQELDLFVVPSICQPLESQPIDMCITRYQHLPDLDLHIADSPDDEMPLEIDLLISLNSYWNFVTGEVRRGGTGPIAMNTRLGWLLSEVTMMPRELQQSHNLLAHVLSIDASPQQDGRLEEVLQSFWRLESWGIDGSKECVLEEFNQTVQFKEGHYEVTLPWKHSHPPLPDNYALYQKRLNGLIHRLRSNPEIMREYNAIIQSQLQQGIVEEFAQTDVVAGQVHYLPHHAVVRKDKETTKVRIVYDASARSTGCFLNECLHKGLKFEQKILNLLLQF